MAYWTHFNCLRESNLINITIDDINIIARHQEIKDAL